MHEVNEMHDLCCRFPVLQAKFIIDAVNNLDVVQDHIRVQNTRQGFFNRLCDSLTGSGTRRQAQVNASLHDSLEGMLQWVQSLAVNQTEIVYALTHAVAHLRMVEDNVATLASYAVENRKMIEKLRSSMECKLQGLEAEVARVDLIQRAQLQLNYVLSQWKAGNFDCFSLAGQSYMVLETLYHGPFGECCRLCSTVRKDLLLTVVNESICILHHKTHLNEDLPRPTIDFWLHSSQQTSSLYNEAVCYLGDWATSETHPFVWALTHGNNAASSPRQLPRICDAQRVVKALQEERFSL